MWLSLSLQPASRAANLTCAQGPWCAAAPRVSAGLPPAHPTFKVSRIAEGTDVSHACAVSGTGVGHDPAGWVQGRQAWMGAKYAELYGKRAALNGTS